LGKLRELAEAEIAMRHLRSKRVGSWHRVWAYVVVAYRLVVSGESQGRGAMQPRRFLTLGPDNEPMQIRLYVQPIGERWAAMIVGDTSPPPRAG
jgi:hypothetical protein